MSNLWISKLRHRTLTMANPTQFYRKQIRTSQNAGVVWGTTTPVFRNNYLSFELFAVNTIPEWLATTEFSVLYPRNTLKK